MSTNNTTNRLQQQSSDQNLSEGLTKHLTTLTSFTIGSASYKAADVISSLQERINAADAVDSTRAAWQTAVKANRDERAKTYSLISGVRQTLQVMFAGSIDTLADFGLKPRKIPAVRTPEEKAAAVAKAKATRKARNTMGPKQKAKIKGTVPPTAPATEPAATAPTAPPAAASPAPATGATRGA
jgi:hypothetical protein